MSKEKIKTILIIILAILVVIGAIFIISGLGDKSDIDVSTNNGENVVVNNYNDDVINTTEDNIEHEENDVDSDLNEEGVIGAEKITPVTEVPDGYVGIYTVSDLVNINSNTEMSYILMNDLDLSSYTDWKGLTNNASFNGNGHTISNLRSTKSGLFNECANVYGLTLENVEIHIEDTGAKNNYGKEYIVGSIANTVKNSIVNCNVIGEIVVKELPHVSDVYVGGIAGIAQESTITSCTNKVSILYNSEGWDNQLVDIVCGGIVGKIENENDSGWVRNCVNNADIYVYGYTREEHFTASYDIDSHHGISGGIVGECTPNIYIDSCINLGDITSSAITSGIVALVEEQPQNKTFVILSCQNFGKAEILRKEGRVDSAYKLGHKASGIIGDLKSGSANISFCNSFGEISGDYKNRGSLVAHSETDKLDIKDCIYVNNAEYNGYDVSMDGKNGMYPESYNNKQISLAEAKKLFPEYFDVSDTTPVRF